MQDSAMLQEAVQALARIDYSFYLEYVYQGSYSHGRHTKLICEKLEAVERGEIDRLIITLPPRHSKSMTATESFPAYFMGKNPKRRTMIAGYNATFARKFGLENRRKTNLFGPELFNLAVRPDRKSAMNWGTVDTKTGGVTGGGMITGGIGGQFTGEGADLLIIDDPFKNRKDADSFTKRETVWNEWTATFQTRLSPTGAVIVIMTRWHEDDLVGRLLKYDDSDWEILNIPCEAEKNDPLGREKGEPLWPEIGFDKAWMERKKKDVGSRDWASLYQQRPSAAAGTIFLRKYWQYYKELPEFLEKQAQSWDVTFKDGRKNDFVVGVVMARKGGNFYVLDLVRGKMSVKTTMEAIRAMTAKHPRAHAKYIEDKANGAAIENLLRDEIPGIILVQNNDGKEARAKAAEPFLESRNVYLPDPSIAPWVFDFVEELANFPSGEYDDQVDAFTQGIMMLRDKSVNSDARDILNNIKVY